MEEEKKKTCTGPIKPFYSKKEKRKNTTLKIQKRAYSFEKTLET